MSNRAKYAKKKGQGEISLEVSMDGKEYSGENCAKLWELGLLLIKQLLDINREFWLLISFLLSLEQILKIILSQEVCKVRRVSLSR